MTLAFSFAPRAIATLLIGVAPMAWVAGIAMAQQRPTPGSVEDSTRPLPPPAAEPAPPTPALPKPATPPAGNGKPPGIKRAAGGKTQAMPSARWKCRCSRLMNGRFFTTATTLGATHYQRKAQPRRPMPCLMVCALCSNLRPRNRLVAHSLSIGCSPRAGVENHEAL